MIQYTNPTKPEPPTILPSVTGIRLWMIPAMVMAEASNPAGTLPVCVSSHARGRKYMLAMQCSKPAATKAEIGRIRPTTLSVTDKIVGLLLPISAFVAAGFEHCIANMYFLPLAWLQTATGKVPAGFDASLITITGIIHNLVPVTLGNIVGGAGLVGFVYWTIYRKGVE